MVSASLATFLSVEVVIVTIGARLGITRVSFMRTELPTLNPAKPSP